MPIRVGHAWFQRCRRCQASVEASYHRRRRLFGFFQREHGGRLPGSVWGFVARTKIVEDGGQAAAVDKLHDVVVDTSVATDVEDRHDVRVVQLRRGLGLDLEPLALLGVDGRGEWEHLQGNAAAQRDLLGLVNDPHAPSANFAEDAVVTQLGAGWE